MVTKVKKGHATLYNAINLYTTLNSCDNMLCLFDSNKTRYEIATEFAKVVDGAKVCKDSKGLCKSYPLINNKANYKVDGKYAAGDSLSYDGRIILKNGISYNFKMNSSCDFYRTYIIRDENGYKIGETQSHVDNCGYVYMDVNNIQGPNQFGVDVYRYDIKAAPKLVAYDQTLLNNALLYNKIKYTKYNIGDEVK